MLRLVTHLLVPPYRPKRKPSKRVAIIVPLSLRATLNDDEQVSVRHLLRYLGAYDKYLVAPRGLPVRVDGFQVKYFSRKFFGSLGAHTRLLSWPGFYRAFADYEFVLFYHLDSLVFSDQLLDWCDRGLDWIGPPWLNCEDSPWVDRPRVGNGGFALLRIERALQVFSVRYRQKPHLYWLDLFTRNGSYFRPLLGFLEKAQKYGLRSRILNRALVEWTQAENPAPYGRNNDLFWADEAVSYVPEFRVATLEEGLRFGFEVTPRKCFELIGGQLPFGCHAWARYDRAFWEPYLLKKEDDDVAAKREPATMEPSWSAQPTPLNR